MKGITRLEIKTEKGTMCFFPLNKIKIKIKDNTLSITDIGSFNMVESEIILNRSLPTNKEIISEIEKHIDEDILYEYIGHIKTAIESYKLGFKGALNLKN